MKNFRTVVAAIAMALAPASVFAATNLVVNGSFEQTPAFSGWTTFYGFNAIPGWNTGPYGVEVQQGGVTVTPKDGNNVVELDTFANSYIWQEIATTPGQEYKLSFFYSPRPGVSFDSNKLVYKFGDLFTWTSADGIGATDGNWYEITGTVIAQNTTTRLGFAAWGPSDSVGGLIDQVSVTAVPEPETYAMLGVGLAAVAFARRRKRL